MAESCNDFFHEVGNHNFNITNTCGPRFLFNNGYFRCHFQGVMRTYLTSKTIFQRSDNASAVCVVIGVRRCHQHHVKRKSNFVTTNLHISFFQHVQQTNLNTLSKVWQFVDGKNSSVRAWHQPVMQSEFVAQVTTLCNFDGVNFTNKVGN